MATYAAPAKEFTLHPAGEHVLFLESREDAPVSEKYLKPGGDKIQWKWNFVSKTKNPETDEGFQFTLFTNIRYGNPDAGLTRFYNNVIPGLSALSPPEAKAKAIAFDADSLVGKWYEVSLNHVLGKETGKPKVDYLWMKPKAKKAAPPPPDDEDETAM